VLQQPVKKAYNVNTMLTAMGASVAAGDSFSLLARTELKKESLVPTPAHLDNDDYEPSLWKYMQKFKSKLKWEIGECEELKSIEENEVWIKTPVPTGTKVIPLKWVYKLKKDRLGNIIRHKCRLVAQGFYQVLVRITLTRIVRWLSLRQYAHYY
jgi:Reverse transcriptase (RNA-dependent DNA polymerase)